MTRLLVPQVVGTRGDVQVCLAPPKVCTLSACKQHVSALQKTCNIELSGMIGPIDRLRLNTMARISVADGVLLRRNSTTDILILSQFLTFWLPLKSNVKYLDMSLELPAKISVGPACIAADDRTSRQTTSTSIRNRVFVWYRLML